MGREKGDLTMFENLDLDNLTPRAKQVLALAIREAQRDGGGIANDGHVLIGLIRLAQGSTTRFLEGRITLDQAREVMSKLTDTSNTLEAVLASAQEEARRYNHSYVGTEHILIGLLEVGMVSKLIFGWLKIDVDELKSEVRGIMIPDNLKAPQQTKPFEFKVVVMNESHSLLYSVFLETTLNQMIEILDMNPEDFAQGSRLKEHAYLFVLWAAGELNRQLGVHIEITERAKQEIIRVVQKAKMTVQLSLPCLPPEDGSSETYRNLNEILAKVSAM